MLRRSGTFFCMDWPTISRKKSMHWNYSQLLMHWSEWLLGCGVEANAPNTSWFQRWIVNLLPLPEIWLAPHSVLSPCRWKTSLTITFLPEDCNRAESQRACQALVRSDGNFACKLKIPVILLTHQISVRTLSVSLRLPVLLGSWVFLRQAITWTTFVSL